MSELGVTDPNFMLLEDVDVIWHIGNVICSWNRYIYIYIYLFLKPVTLPKFHIDTKNMVFIKCISFQIWLYFGYPFFWFSGGVVYIPFPKATPSFFGTAQFVKFLSENLQRHLDQLIERLKSVPWLRFSVGKKNILEILEAMNFSSDRKPWWFAGDYTTQLYIDIDIIISYCKDPYERQGFCCGCSFTKLNPWASKNWQKKIHEKTCISLAILPVIARQPTLPQRIPPDKALLSETHG